MLKILSALLFSLFALPLQANQVEIIHAELESQSGMWVVRVTLQHQDEGWKHFADAWRVVSEDGKVLGERTLYHPHVNEQPFTRTLSGLNIPASVKRFYIEAHDKVHGWSKDRLLIDLSKNTGKRYKIRLQ
ncbi:MAG: hypothetical protein OQK73_07425 [Gammaproteobacteria bacterium]|nr:hypothetical protein [Gammaproteobacteria bacterium]